MHNDTLYGALHTANTNFVAFFRKVLQIITHSQKTVAMFCSGFPRIPKNAEFQMRSYTIKK